MNDPMEGSFRQSKRLKGARTYTAAVQAQLGKVGIASFCEVSKHVLMWAHYTDQFQGICIAYDLRELVNHMNRDVAFTRIAYADTAATLTKERTDTEAVAKRILSRKTRAWLYEREWRMFSPTQGRQVYGAKLCVRRVLIGHKMPDRVRAVVERRLTRAKIKFEPLDKDDLVMSI